MSLEMNFKAYSLKHCSAAGETAKQYQIITSPEGVKLMKLEPDSK